MPADMQPHTDLRPGVPVLERRSSILFTDDPAAPSQPGAHEPDYFRDLNLDQLVATLTQGRDQFDLASLFWTPLASEDAVRYRQDVLRDLERPPVRAAMHGFVERMEGVRGLLARASSVRHPIQSEHLTLEAMRLYVTAAAELDANLQSLQPPSAGLAGAARSVADYLASASFRALESESQSVQNALASVHYRMVIRADQVTVTRSADEPDLAADVAATFERFRQGESRTHVARVRESAEMNHVEEAVVERVAQLFPDEFSALRELCGRHGSFVEPLLLTLERETHFYLAFLELAERLRGKGLSLCYPQLVDVDAGSGGSACYDMVLADHLGRHERPDASDGSRGAGPQPMVVNDFALEPHERVMVVTGPNQGGKTTFARMVGQQAHLAGLGLMVPGTRAYLPLTDHIRTHFEGGENLTDFSGALDDDLHRARAMPDGAGPRSLLIVNEIFMSTSPDDALLLSRRILEQVVKSRSRAVVVTFLDELATFDPSVVSMVAQIDPDTSHRTFNVRRQPPDGRAYAEAMARAHGLDTDSLRRRLS